MKKGKLFILIDGKKCINFRYPEILNTVLVFTCTDYFLVEKYFMITKNHIMLHGILEKKTLSVASTFEILPNISGINFHIASFPLVEALEI